MKKQITQKEQVRKHLKKHGSITTMKAFSMYNITRLSRWIMDLRKEGMDISTKWTKNKLTGTNYGIYKYSR